MDNNFFVKRPSFPWLVICIGLLCFPGLGISEEMGKSNHMDERNQNNVDTPSQQDQYRQLVKNRIQEAEDLLSDLLERVETRTGEERENLQRAATKMHAELEHAKRIVENFEGEDAKQWLRNNTELNAVMANLEVAYDRALPFLRDKARLLQKAVERTGDALFYKEQKDLFQKMTDSALKFAQKAQQEGLHSEFVQEAIARLREAQEKVHVNLDDAVEKARRAHAQLQSALKHHRDSLEHH